MNNLFDLLTEEELAIYKRGRIKSNSRRKTQTRRIFG